MPSVDVSKPHKKYVWAYFYGRDDPTGHGVILKREDQVGTDNVAFTTEVITYDESMGIIETANTIYIPA